MNRSWGSIYICIFAGVYCIGMHVVVGGLSALTIKIYMYKYMGGENEGGERVRSQWRLDVALKIDEDNTMRGRVGFSH